MQPLPLASRGGQNKILLPGSLLDSRDPCLQIGLDLLSAFGVSANINFCSEFISLCV